MSGACWTKGEHVVELRLSLREEDIKMLIRLRDFLNDLIETIEVMSDEELLQELREALEDVEKGRVMDWEDFVKEERESRQR